MPQGPAPLLRLFHASVVLAREGVLALIPPSELPSAARFLVKILRLAVERRGVTRRDAGARLSAALNKLGPSYVKLGQFLATRADVVGEDVARELARLQDQVPPVPDADAYREIEAALGQPVTAMYETLGHCVAAASIAQVYHATARDKDGTLREVAVKVLRPGVARRFEHDLQSFFMAAWALERFVRPARRLKPVAIVETLARSVRFEMDLRLEAAAMSEIAENIREDAPDFRVPEIDWRRTAKSVLTMQWIDGVKISNVPRLREMGLDLPTLAAVVLQSFLRHAMRDGFFHADMHQGNLFIETDGTLVAVDWGITGRLSVQERGFLARILLGFIRRDYHGVAQLHFEAGYVPLDQDVDTFAQALRAIGEPLRGQTAHEISMSRLLAQLFEVTELFQMQTQPQLIQLQKTMVVVEGVARSLDPQLDIWQIAEPVVREMVVAELGPGAQLRSAANSIAAMARIMGDLPDLVERGERIIARMEQIAMGGVELSPGTMEALAKGIAVRSVARTGALMIGALSLLVIAITMVV